MMALARLDWPAFCNILVFDGPLQGLGRQEEPLIADLLLTEISLSRSRPASVCPSVCLSVLKARVSPLGYIFPPSFHRLSLVSKKKKRNWKEQVEAEAHPLGVKRGKNSLRVVPKEITLNPTMSNCPCVNSS